MYLALLGISFYISWIDIKSHRISNKSLAFASFLFLILALIESAPMHSYSVLVFLALTPIFLFFKVGAGDLKLLILLSFYFLPFTFTTYLEFISGFSVISACLALLTGLKMRSLRSNIALAPAICGAVIWCAR